jgi:hypothetical protein
VGRAGARAHRCSPALVEEDEPDGGVMEGCSLEHEWWQRGGVSEVKNGNGLILARGRRKAWGNSGERGKRDGEGRGCSSSFIVAEGAPLKGGRGGNGWC